MDSPVILMAFLIGTLEDEVRSIYLEKISFNFDRFNVFIANVA